MSETKSQNSKILEMLKAKKAVTPLTALRDAGTLRLSGRILELRQAGHAIKKDMIAVGKKRVASYYLAA